MKRKGMIKRLREKEGVTLIEILIGVIILSVALLGLAAAGGVAARQVYMGRVDMGRWAALQQQLESLVATGTDPKQITLVMTRENFRGETVQDTLVTYMADPN
jgi:prepilin-type N-terminal cleavage/methylation domain-containing protein